MKLFVLSLILITVILTGCGGSIATSTISLEYTTPTGSVVTVTKTSTVESKSDTANPPQVSMEGITLDPKVIGEVSSTDEEGNNNRIPEIGLAIITGGANAAGSFLSDIESLLPIFKWPMIIGSVCLVGGIILWFVPFPLPILKRVGMVTAIAGAALMYLSVQFASMLWLFSIVGILIVVGVGGWLVWYLISRKSKALKETVQSLEYVKETLPEQKKEELFDKTAAPVPLIQSPTTQVLVDDIRTKQGFDKK